MPPPTIPDTGNDGYTIRACRNPFTGVSTSFADERSGNLATIPGHTLRAGADVFPRSGAHFHSDGLDNTGGDGADRLTSPGSDAVAFHSSDIAPEAQRNHD